MNNLKYFSMFSGIGGFELGIQYAYEELKLCQNVKDVEVKKTSTQTTNQDVENVSMKTKKNGDKKTLKKVDNKQETLIRGVVKQSWKHTEESVPVVEKQLQSSSPLTTKTTMGQKREENLVAQEDSIVMLSNKDFQIHTKSFAITATTQKEHMDNVPICVGFSEIDKYAISVYKKHFPNHYNFNDATKIITSELPDFDLLVGGFPCQAFSIAGKRKGFDDTRGTLFFDIARILADKKPKHLVLENVKGLLSHEGGRTFTTIIRVLTDLGYFVEWQVLNAKNFGVPQNRERVFIVGHLGGEPRPKVFPITNDSGEIIERIKRERITTARTRNFGSSAQLHEIDEVCSTLTQSMGTGGNNVPCVLGDKNENAFAVKTNMTITSNDIEKKRRTAIIENSKIRRLTPLECERLMGYPDNWTQGLSDTQRYKCCGNGIVSNVVKEVIKRLI